MIYWKLFLSFLQIGLLSIGGGYAAIPLIQDQVVVRHDWLTLSEFADLVKKFECIYADFQRQLLKSAVTADMVHKAVGFKGQIALITDFAQSLHKLRPVNDTLIGNRMTVFRLAHVVNVQRPKAITSHC